MYWSTNSQWVFIFNFKGQSFEREKHEWTFFLSILLKVNFRMFTIYSGTCILFSFNSRFMVSPNKQIFIVKHHFCWILNLCFRWFWQWQFLFSEVKVFIKENKKVKALRLLALRVAAHLKWNLNIILTG